MRYGALPATSGADLRCEGGGINRAAASAKRLGDGGHDKTERGEPTHSPDQQLRHAAVFPCCQRMAASYEGKSRKSQCQKKNPAVAAGLFVLAGLLVNDASPASQRLAEVS